MVRLPVSYTHLEEIKDIDETTGEFTIVATTDYDYVSAEKAGKTQMVALHVDGSALSERCV